jgi:hypothetical protein
MYTLRPRKRTDGGVFRLRHREQQKLYRQSPAGPPRGLRGKFPRCSFAPQQAHPAACAWCAHSVSTICNSLKNDASFSNFSIGSFSFFGSAKKENKKPPAAFSSLGRLDPLQSTYPMDANARPSRSWNGDKRFMPVESKEAGSPQDWLRHARSDLAL